MVVIEKEVLEKLELTFQQISRALCGTVSFFNMAWQPCQLVQQDYSTSVFHSLPVAQIDFPNKVLVFIMVKRETICKEWYLMPRCNRIIPGSEVVYCPMLFRLDASPAEVNNMTWEQLIVIKQNQRYFTDTDLGHLKIKRLQ